MRRTVLIAFAAVAVATGSAAMAADMPVKAPVYKAPVPAWTWDGWYIGANVGYSWGKWDSTCAYFATCFVGTPGTFIAATPAGNIAAQDAFFASFTNTADPKVDGWLVGLHAGRNWQYQNLVIGWEADFDMTGEKGAHNGTSFLSVDQGGQRRFLRTTSVVNEWKFQSFSTTRGRLGWAADTWLLYTTGGLAVGRVGYSATRTTTVANTLAGVQIASATDTSALSEAKTKVGFAVGAGFEKMFGLNWVARAEYLYIDLGTHRFFDGVTIDGNRWDTDVRLRDHIVRVGISCLFNSPIVAKY
jgi:outer membrane immunogenic protein